MALSFFRLAAGSLIILIALLSHSIARGDSKKTFYRKLLFVSTAWAAFVVYLAA